VIVARELTSPIDFPEIGYMPKRIRRKANRPTKSRARSDAKLRPSKQLDPLLALRGLGRELWKELGGGEKFILELRKNWYGNEDLANPRHTGH
jgi:hypothetical protein